MLMKLKYEGTGFITGIRAVAVLLVFIIHSGASVYFEKGSYLYNLVNIGKFGVQIFFVISGFTIFYQIYHARYSYSDFIKIRVLRICAPYYPILIFMFSMFYFNIIDSSYWNNEYNNGIMEFENLFMHMTFLGFHDVKYINTILSVEWTLYVEMFLYLTMGLLISRVNFTSSVYPSIILLVVSIFIYEYVWYLNNHGDIDWRMSQWLPFKYIVMFTVGGISYLIRNKFIPSSNLASNLSISVFISHLLLSPYISYDMNERAFTLTTALVICFARNDSFMSLLFNNRASQILGLLSFSFYLIHFPVLTVIKGFGLEPINVVIFGFMLTLLLSFLSYVIFEVKIYGEMKILITKNRKSNAPSGCLIDN